MKGKMKKVITIVLAFAMVLSFQVSAFAEDLDLNAETQTTVSEEMTSLEEETQESTEETVAEQEAPSEETETQVSDEQVSENEILNVESYSESYSELAVLSDDITGTFPIKDGYELATIRYYTDASKSAYEFADFTESASGYSYAFASPYAGFSKVQGEQTKDSDPDSSATVIAYYYSTTKWDSSVDVSWYDPSASEYYISNPAEFAGVAAIVNGSLDASVKDYMVKGERIADSEKKSGYTYRFDMKYIVSQWLENQTAAAGKTNDVYMGLAENDFSGKVINLTSDLDMGGKDGSEFDISFAETNYTELDESLPNWMPIGGFFLADIKDTRTQVRAYFNGQFDGCGHNITNLYCFRWNPWYSGMNYAAGCTSSDEFCAYGYTESVGLFGNIARLYDGEETPTIAPAIRNLSLSGITVGRRRQGGIVGCISGYDAAQTVCIENCANHADVYNTDKFGCGGIVGACWRDDDPNFKVSIVNCYNTGDIYADIQCLAAGIVSYNECADVICCYNTGDISTNGNKRGRQIGSDYTGSNYTISDTYYLHKRSYDDPDSSDGSPGYYTGTISESSSINFTKPVEISQTELTDGTLLNSLNVNGEVFVTGSDGSPVLWFENGETKEDSTVTIEQPEDGGVITGSIESGSKVKFGTIVRLSAEEKNGWTFKYFTLNGKKLSADYAAIGADSVISGVIKSSEPGILNIESNKYIDISVKKNGIIKKDGETVQVTNYPVVDGESVYQKDRLFVTVTLKEGAIPDDPDYEFKETAGLVNPYSYSFVYTNGEHQTGYDNVFDVDANIDEEEAQLTLSVTPLTTPKLWITLADTSWYNKSDTSFTLYTAAQLAGLDKLVEEGNTFSGKTIKLGADIDLTNTDGTTGKRCWNGIGSSEKDSSTSETVYHAFAGTFDGQNHSIKNYAGVSGGLFDTCIGNSESNPAVIKNVSVYGTAKGEKASAILGYGKNVTVENCNSYVVIDTSDELKSNSYAGGIVAYGLNGTTIENCINYGQVTGCGYIGGIAGYLNTETEVSECVNKGDITLINYSTMGGGVSGEVDGTVDQCANYGTVTSLAEGAVLNRIGGIAGYTAATSSKKITNSYNVGKVVDKGGSSAIRIGGLIGWGNRFIISDCFNYGTVELNADSKATYYGSLIGLTGKNSSNRTLRVYIIDTSCDKVAEGKAYDDLDTSKTYYSGITLSTAENFKNSNGVISSINGEGCFVLTNDYPELQFIAESVHVHSGGKATCVAQAVCEVCGLSYGELDPDNHTETETGHGSYKPAWNIDGYTGDTVCLGCGKVLEKGEAIKADTSQKAVTFKIYRGELKDTAELIYEKEFTIAEFDALKSTGAVGYAYGSYEDGTGYSVIMAANSYVTLDTLLEKSNYTLDDIYRFNVIATGNSTDSTESFKLTPERLKTHCYFYDENGNKIYAPFAIAIDHGTYESGSLEEAAKHTTISGNLRLGVGVSEEEFKNKDSLGGNKLIEPIKEIELYVKEEASEAGIKLDQTEAATTCVGSFKLKATVTGTSSEEVNWSSSDESVATVDSEGNVKAIGVGEAVIKAESGIYAAKCNVTVSHSLVKTAAKAATCTEAGNTEYWTCSACGKYFADAEGKTEIEKDSWIVSAGHKLKKTAAKAATYAKAGNTAYWTCSVCGKYFSDSKGKKEIKKNSWVISKLKVSATKITYAKNTGSKKVTLKWKKVSGVTGYQILYKVGSKSKTITVKGAAKVKKVLSKLTKGKTYSFKVRCYKTVSKKNYYSAWSAVKKVKITK